MLKYFTYALVLTSLLVNLGCSKDGSSDSSGPVYTGKSTAAIITNENGKEIVTGTLSSDDSDNLSKVFNAANLETTQSEAFYKIAENIALTTKHLNESSSYFSAATETISGNCGGTAKINSSSETNVEITFSNFCDTDEFNTSGAKFSGKMSMSISGNDSRFQMSMALTNFSVVGKSNNVAVDMLMAGSMTMVVTSDETFSLTMTLVTQDNLTSQVSKSENFKIFLSGGDTITISGRMYDPEHGFVDLTTESPIKLNSVGEITSGELKATGLDSSATLAFEDDTFILSVDEDDDGTAESTETGTLESLGINSFV